MNCHDFEMQLEQAVDERKPVNESVLREHAESCPACAEHWQDFLLIESAITGWRIDLFEVEIVDRVVEAARAKGLVASDSSTVTDTLPVPIVTHRSEVFDIGVSPRRRLWPTVVTVALALVAAVFVLRERPDQFADDGSRDSSPEQFVEAPEFHFAPDLKHAPPDLDALVADARDAWLRITRQATRRADDFRIFVPDISTDLGLESEPSESPNENDHPDGEAAPDRIQRAFDFLFEASGPPQQQTT